eukprot:TRINITY_DN2682_c0_g1_i6.p1 TRINITY_DN2682_c0_g1~~TRINITY_DN2682_c0_g1_i6.p1  ORF type:complete len:236 (+),score=74.36 TRINITY_DN2682_c0_g1_i6:101-808(+)
MLRSLVGSEMCIRDSINAEYMGKKEILTAQNTRDKEVAMANISSNNIIVENVRGTKRQPNLVQDENNSLAFNEGKYNQFNGYNTNASRMFGKDIANFSTNSNQENIYALANRVKKPLSPLDSSKVPAIRGFPVREETGDEMVITDPPRMTKRASFITEKFASYKDLNKDCATNSSFINQSKTASMMAEEPARPATAMEEEMEEWDVEDLNNIQCVSIYAKEIFKHLKENEVLSLP